VRCLGPYDAKSVPSFATLVAGSTEVRRAKLQCLQEAVTRACAAYDAALPDVHCLEAIKITQEQRNTLIDSYEGRTVAVKLRLANMIASLPPAHADLCPYCSLDTSPDLDHFLPKSRFPEFSLHARNLVPICTSCNRKKQNAFKTKVGGDRLFLHPSVEPRDNVVVLEADLTFKDRAIVVDYHIGDAGLLSESERSLVERHYFRLGLRVRYSRRAHSYLAAFKASVAGESRSTVAQILESKIRSAPVGEPVNGWRPALYRAVCPKKAQTLAWLWKD